METLEEREQMIERAAARWNETDGVRRYGPAFGVFAEAVGHVTAIRDPELYSRSFVGVWASEDELVSDFIEESGLNAALDQLPAPICAFAVIDRRRVNVYLHEQLLVLPADDRVWVFDAAPDVVKTTVHKSEREAHSDA